MNSQAVLQAHHQLLEPSSSTTNSASSTDPAQSKGKHPYHVGKIKIQDSEYKNEVPEHLQNQEIPGFPSTVAVIGKPGGGKTNLCMNLLLNDVFWHKFFDKIYLLGPTVKMDKLFKQIQIPDDQIVTEPDEFIPKLVEWVRKQEDAVKTDPKTAPKVLFFFEDITAYRTTVQHDPEFARCFTTIRHHKASAIVNFHKYTALERTARINCMHICVFPVNQTDIDQLYKEYATSHLDPHDFVLMCRYCWKPDEENKKPFLYINMYQPDEMRFRKCFTKIIDLSQFEGLGKLVKEKRKQKFLSMLGRDKEQKYNRSASSSRPAEQKDWTHGHPILESLDASLEKKMGDMSREPSKEKIKEQNEEGWQKGGGSVFGRAPKSYNRNVMGNVFAYLR